MPSFDIDRSKIPLWSGANGKLALQGDFDLNKPLKPGDDPIASASFQVEGGHDIKLASDGAVGISVKAGARVRIVPMFQENQGAGADLIARFSFVDALTAHNLLVGLEIGGDAQVGVEGSFKHAPLTVNGSVQAGVDAVYTAIKAFPRDVRLLPMLQELFKDLQLPGAIVEPPDPGDLVSFEYGGALKYSVGASAGYEIKGTKSFKVSEIALSEHYAASIVGKLTLSGQVSGRFSVDVTAGSRPGFARVIVKRRRQKELQIAADVLANASLTTEGLPRSGKEFLGAIVGLQAKNWLNMASTLVTKDGKVDSVETLQKKVDGLGQDFLGELAGKAIGKLTDVPEVRAFQDQLAKVVESYRNLDGHAIALFDRFFDPALDRIGELTSKLDELKSMTSWDQLKGEINPMLWNVIRQLTGGDPLGWALGVIPGTSIPSLPELKKRIADTTALIQDAAHDQIRKFIRLAKEKFGLDPLFNQLATISSTEDLKAVAGTRLGHFVERLIGSALDKLNGNALKRAGQTVQQISGRRDAFFKTFDRILEEAASQKATLALHAAYNRASERDALIDMEIRLRNPDGSPNAVGQRYMAAAGRGDFQEALASFQPEIVVLREGVLSHKVSTSTSLTFNVAGWHNQFNYQAMHRVIVETEQQIRDAGNGVINVFTTVDLKADSERRRRTTKSEEVVLCNFLLRLLGETKVNDSSFDRDTQQYVIDVISGMSARYGVTFTDEDTSSRELDDYLNFAKSLGLDTVGATRAALLPFLEFKNDNCGRTSSTYDVRYVPSALSRLLSGGALDKKEVVAILRRIVVANYFSHPVLHEVGWLYSSDDVRALFDEHGNNFVDMESVLRNADVTLVSPIPGISPPNTVASSKLVRNDVATLFRIEDAVVNAFGELQSLLEGGKKIKTADLEKKLGAFGRALDAFDGFDNGDNSIFAVFDGLVQLRTPAAEARASSLTFVSTRDGAERTKVFTLQELAPAAPGV